MVPAPRPREPWCMSITEWAVSLMESLGAPGAGVAIAAENVFPPIPSEVILPLAGFTASRGDLSLGGALLWTTIGSVVGALALYGLGAWLGRDRLRRVIDRMPLVDLQDVDRAEVWFGRHGGRAVFLGRFVPIVRSLISVPAGVERMPLRTFLAYTALGSGLWNCCFVLLGYGLGENWTAVESVVGVYARGVLVAAVLAGGVFLVLRLRRGPASLGACRSPSGPCR